MKAASEPPLFAESCPELEQQLNEHFDALRQSFDQCLSGTAVALILGGGYGRGEGGIFHDETGVPLLYNDLDYFLFTAQPDNPGLGVWAREIEETWTEKLGIDVEIHLLTPEKLRDTGDMMYFDLVHGHRVVAGPPNFLSSYRDKFRPRGLRSDEGTRLLWNRGSGLYFSACRLQRPELSSEDIAFIHRNHQKCRLAFGDAMLCLEGQ